MNKITQVKIESRQSEKTYETTSLDEANDKLHDLTSKGSFEDDKFDLIIYWNDGKKIASRLDASKKDRSPSLLTTHLKQMTDYWSKNGELGDAIGSMIKSNNYEGLIKE